MRVLYGIQGTGNGHISRAEEIIPILKKMANVDVLISGNQSQVQSAFDVNYRKNGLTFLSSRDGKVDLYRTIINSKPIRLIKEIKSFEAHKYDLVISDFEPVSAWSALVNGIPCVELSHQAAVLNQNAPQPELNDRISKYILTHYCPTKLKYGFHFQSYSDKIFTPVIRNQVRQLEPKNKDYFTVYLPAYHDDVLWQILDQFDVEWHVFSKFTKQAYRLNNIYFNPIDHSKFKASLENCQGVICGAGFELPSEALFLKKKLLVVPMLGQYEQACNAESLRKMGITVLPSFELLHHRTIKNWIENGKIIDIDYPDCTEEILQKLITDYTQQKIPKESFGKIVFDPKFYRYFL
ncbi:MAG: glycosyltransferase family protein [Crocinitomicaceae bacterium]|jgi:uncharacterized protein (TIGR00661 family)